MRILKNATRLGALAFAGVTTAIPIAGPVVVTFKTLETRALVKREQFPGNGAYGAQFGAAYLSSASSFGVADQIETFFISGVDSTYIAFPNDATAYCFAVPGATATAISNWVSAALVINSAPVSLFLSDLGLYVAESLSLFDSACGVQGSSSPTAQGAIMTTPFSIGSSSPSASSPPSPASPPPSIPSPSLSAVQSSAFPSSPASSAAVATSAHASFTSVAQDPTDSYISVLESIIPQTALNDPKAQCFLFTEGASTPAWYSALPSGAQLFLQSIEATDTAGCNSASITVPGSFTPATTPTAASTFITTSGGSTVIVTTTTPGTTDAISSAGASGATRPGGVGFFGQTVVPSGTSGTSTIQSSSSTASPSTGSGLSTGAKAGIGGGVAGGVLIIGVIAGIVAKSIAGSSGSAAAGKAALANTANQPPPPTNTADTGPYHPVNPQTPYDGNPGNMPPQPPQGAPNAGYPPPMHQDSQAPVFLGAAVAARRHTQSPDQSQYSRQGQPLSPGAYSPSSPRSEHTHGGSGQWSPGGSNQYLIQPQHDPRYSGGMPAQYSGGSMQPAGQGPSQYTPHEVGQGGQAPASQLSTEGARYEMGPGGSIRPMR